MGCGALSGTGEGPGAACGDPPARWVRWRGLPCSGLAGCGGKLALVSAAARAVVACLSRRPWVLVRLGGSKRRVVTQPSAKQP